MDVMFVVMLVLVVRLGSVLCRFVLVYFSVVGLGVCSLVNSIVLFGMILGEFGVIFICVIEV